MCPLEKIASCQIAFIPIESDDYIRDVEHVIKIISEYGLEYHVDILSTTIRGRKDRILALIKDIFETMDDACGFTMDIKISNVCGCSHRDDVL